MHEQFYSTLVSQNYDIQSCKSPLPLDQDNCVYHESSIKECELLSTHSTTQYQKEIVGNNDDCNALSNVL